MVGKKKEVSVKPKNGSIEIDVKTKGRRGRRNRNGRGGAGAPISTSVSILPTNSPKMRVHGTDRVIHIPEAKFQDGSVMVDIPISSELVPRLAHLAEAYQRIRFKKLVFHIVSMCPTTTSGGIAAAFVADPTDVLSGGNDSLNRVVAQNGSKVTKIWQSALIRSSLSGDLLYTSAPPLGDTRLYSPGRLWVVCESKFSTPVPLTIYMDWDVELSVPSLEVKTKEGAGAIILKSNFYTRTSNPGFWYRDSGGGDDPRPMAPGIQFDVVYQAKSKSYIDFGDVAGSFDRFIMVNDSVHGVTFTAVGMDNKPIISVTKKNQWVLEKGQPLYPVPENTVTGLEFICNRSPSCRLSDPKSEPPQNSKSSSQKNLTNTSKSLLSQLKGSKGSLSLSELTLAQLKELPTEYLSSLREQSRSPSFEVLDEDECGVFSV